MELAKSYLLRRGPYAFSRHLMYLSELTLFFSGKPEAKRKVAHEYQLSCQCLK